MEIVDPADVEASGDGLQSAEINRRAMFNVDIGRNGSSRDLKVQIRCTSFINDDDDDDDDDDDVLILVVYFVSVVIIVQ